MSTPKREDEAPLCACGYCDEKVTWNKHKKTWNKYIKGHNAKGEGNPNYGMTGEKNPSKRPEVRKKISEKAMGKKRLDMMGENNPSFSKERAERKAEGAPFCKCGCEEKTKWNSNTGKYNEYIHTHHVKGENNPQYNKKQTEKRAKIKAKGAPICGCGYCNERTKWNGKGYNRFVVGHNSRGENNPIPKGSKRSDISGDNNYMRKHPEARKAASERMLAIGDDHWMKQSENKVKISGKNNPNYGKIGPLSSSWQGGISAEPYCDIWLDKEYKESILDRDNYECQNPDCWQNCNHLSLCLHHIHYDKKECNPWDLITVCKGCNGRANVNKGYWQDLYQGIMTEKYGYKYELDEAIGE